MGHDQEPQGTEAVMRMEEIETGNRGKMAAEGAFSVIEGVAYSAATRLSGNCGL